LVTRDGAIGPPAPAFHPSWPRSAPGAPAWAC